MTRIATALARWFVSSGWLPALTFPVAWGFVVALVKGNTNLERAARGRRLRRLMSAELMILPVLLCFLGALVIGMFLPALAFIWNFVWR